MTACPHTALIHSDGYPRGTRCSQCGQSVESLFANCRAQLTIAQASLEAALARVSKFEATERELAATHRELEETRKSIGNVSELREQLAQAETHLRNEQHYHQQTKNELQAALQQSNEFDSMLRAALNREEDLQKKLAGAEAALSLQTERVIEAENKKDPVLHSSRDPFPYTKARK